MSYNLYLHDKLLEERRQLLQDKATRRHMLSALPHRAGIGRRAVGRLGVALIAVGSWLEQFEHGGKPVMQSVR
jgi:hypothetical protein